MFAGARDLMLEFVKLTVRASLRGSGGYYRWLVFLALWMVLGAIAWGYQLDRGLVVTHMTDQVSWGAYIGNFTFLVGIAAAAVILVVPAYLYRQHDMGDVVVYGELMAIAAVMMCILFLGADLGRPDRFWHMIPLLGSFNWPASLLTWDVLALVGYLGLNIYLATGLLYAKFAGRDTAAAAAPPSERSPGPIGPAVAVLPPVELLRVDQRARATTVRPVVYVAIVWAISIHTVTAFLYSGLGARPYWNAAIHAPNFLATAFAAGPAAMIVVLVIARDRLGLPVRESAIRRLRQIGVGALIIHLFLLGCEVFTELYAGSSHAAGLRYRLFGLHGHHALVAYTWLGIGFCLVGTVGLLTQRIHRRKSLLLAACGAVIAGVWIDKSIGMVVPGFVPSPLGETFDYLPSFVELCVSAGIWASGLLLFTLLVRAAVAVQLGRLRLAPADGAPDSLGDRGLPPELARLALGGQAVVAGVRGVPDRMQFDDRLQEEWGRARRGNVALALMLIEVDAMADAEDVDELAPDHSCLRRLAQTIRGVPSRPGDFVARYSAQQFAVILPNTDRVGSIEVAESIRNAVESARLPRSAALADRPITICVGVTVMAPYSEVPAPRLLSAARQALSVAKTEGPNQTRVALLDEGPS